MFLEQCPKITADEIVQQAMQKVRDGLLQTGAEISGQSVQMTTTKTQFGGERLWFICPSCQRRCGTLRVHPISSQLGCHLCLDLTYHKQRYSRMLESKPPDR